MKKAGNGGGNLLHTQGKIYKGGPHQKRAARGFSSSDAGQRLRSSCGSPDREQGRKEIGSSSGSSRGSCGGQSSGRRSGSNEEAAAMECCLLKERPAVRIQTRKQLRRLSRSGLRLTGLNKEQAAKMCSQLHIMKRKPEELRGGAPWPDPEALAAA